MSAWTPERMERLKALHKEGLSASQIAKALGEVSRNSVIGKAHRMGLGPIGGGRASAPDSRNAATAAARGVLMKAKAAKPRLAIAGRGTVFEVAEAPPPRVVVDRAEAFSPLPGTEPAPFLAREGARCRWPVDMAEAGHWCCGADTGDVAVSYCRAHANLSKSKDTRIKTGRAYERSLRRYAA